MNTEKIKTSLIHIYNKTIHEALITLTGDYPNCGILFTSSITQDIEVKGHDYFKCLLNLRIELEKLNYYILCNGARRDISCGGMLREASDGLSAYIIKLGEYCHVGEDVDIFEYAEPNLVVSIKEQEEFSKIHQNSLPAIIDYYAEFIKPISSKTRENIIQKLLNYSDWELVSRKSLFREGDRLCFKFFNTPKQPHWNVEIEIYNNSVYIMLTLGNDGNQEVVLTLLKEQLTLNNVAYNLK